MNQFHNITAKADENNLNLNVDGRQFRLRWADCSVHLAKATFSQRKIFEISPSGYGIHWLEIDEYLAIDPLLEHATMVEKIA